MGGKLRTVLSVAGSADRARRHAVQDVENVHPKLRARLEGLLGKPLSSELGMLDLGCGYGYPNVILFKAEGIDVCGVDVEPVFFRDGRPAAFRRGMREKGLLRALNCAGPGYSESLRYHAELAALSGVDVDHQALSLHTYDGCHLPFADEAFSVIYSNAVLEHVEDLSAFVEEAARVLSPGGVVDMLWHNFYSPSGGHRFEADVAASPWGHVTGESPPACFLNKKKPDEIRTEFEKRLRVLRVVGAASNQSLEGDADFEREGASLLNDDWRAKLSGLPDRLLTTCHFVIQAVKQG